MVMKDRRHQPGRQPGLMGERQMFIVRTRERQRPALADQAHIGQRLLDGDCAVLASYDEDEVEIAVAYFADRPVRRRSAELGCDRGKLRKVVSQIRLAQNPVFVPPGGIQPLV